MKIDKLSDFMLKQVCPVSRAGKSAVIIRQAVRPLPPKGGDAYADYFDVACLRTYRDDQNKKAKPPLGQVTVLLT